jgi:hypothetical protein
MVKYYGRAKERTGSINTNQIGLNMSGCPSKVGRQGYLNRYIASRVQCNQKYCGPVFYQGQLWNFNNENCVPKAPRGESFNSGVGHINAPRFSCGQTCKQNLSPDDALCLLKAYYEKSNPPEINMMNVAFAAGDEDCLDLGNEVCEAHPSEFYVLTKGSPEFKNAPPQIQYAITVLNNIQFRAKLKANGEPVLHYVAIVSDLIASQLQAKNFGFPLNFGKCNLIAYGLNSPGAPSTPSDVVWNGNSGLWIEAPGAIQEGSKSQGGKNLYSTSIKNNPEYMTAWMYSIWNFVQKQKIKKIVVRLPNCGTTPKGYTTDTSKDTKTNVSGGSLTLPNGTSPVEKWPNDPSGSIPDGTVPIDLTTGLRIPPCPFPNKTIYPPPYPPNPPSPCALTKSNGKVYYPDGIMASGYPVAVESGEPDIWPRWEKTTSTWSWLDAEAAWARLSCTGRNPNNNKATAPYLNNKTVSSIYYVPQVNNYQKATGAGKQTWDKTFAPWTLAWLADKMLNSEAGLESWQWLRASESKRFMGSNPDPGALPSSYNNLKTTYPTTPHQVGSYDNTDKKVWIGSEDAYRSTFPNPGQEPQFKTPMPKPYFAPYPYSFCSKYPLLTSIPGEPSYIEMSCGTAGPGGGLLMEASGNDKSQYTDGINTPNYDPSVGHHKYWTRMQDETYLDLLFQVQVIKIFKKRVLGSKASSATAAAGKKVPNFDTGLLFEFEGIPEQFHRNHGMMPKLATGHKNINSLLSNLVRVSKADGARRVTPSGAVDSTDPLIIDNPHWRWGITAYAKPDPGLSGANNAYAIWDLFNNSEYKTSSTDTYKDVQMKMEIFPEWYGNIGKAIDTSYIGRKLINDFDNSLSANDTAGDILMKSAQYGAYWGKEVPDKLTGGVEGLIRNEYDPVKDQTSPKYLPVVNQTNLYNGCVACAHDAQANSNEGEDIYRIDGWNTVSQYLADGTTKNPQYPSRPTPDTALIQITPYQYAIFTNASDDQMNQTPTDDDYPKTVDASSNWTSSTGPSPLKADIFNSLEQEFMWSDVGTASGTEFGGSWKDGFAFRAKAPIIEYWRNTWNTITTGYKPGLTNNFNRQWGSKVSGVTMETASTGKRNYAIYVLVRTPSSEPTAKLQKYLEKQINAQKMQGEGIPLSTYTKQINLTAVAGAPKYPYTLCRTRYVPGNEGAGKNLFVYCTFNKSQDQIQISSVYVATTGSSQSGIGPTGIPSNYMDYDQLEVIVPGALLAPLNGSQQDQVGATITLRTNSNDKFYFQDKFITIPTTRTNAKTGPYTALVSIEPFFMGGPPNMIGRRVDDDDVTKFHNTKPGKYPGWILQQPWRVAEWMVDSAGSSFKSMKSPFTIYTFELTFDTSLNPVPAIGKLVTQGPPTTEGIYPVKGTIRSVGFGIPTSVDASGHIFTLIFDKDLGIPPDASGGVVTQGTQVCGGMHGDQCTFPVSGTVQSYALSPPTLTVIRDHGSLPFTKVPTAIAGAPTFILVVTGGGEHDPGQPAPNHGTFVKNIDTLVDTTHVPGSELQWVDGPTLIKGMPPVWLDRTDIDGTSPLPIIPDDNIPGWPIIKSQDGKYDPKKREVGSFFGKIWDLPFLNDGSNAMTSWLQKVRGIASGGGTDTVQNNLVSTMYFAQSYILPTFNNQTVFCDDNISNKDVDPTKNKYISGACPSEDFIDSFQPLSSDPTPIKIPRSTSIVPIAYSGLDFWNKGYNPIMGGPKWMDYYLTGTVYGGDGVGTEGGNNAIPTLNRFQNPDPNPPDTKAWAN